MDKDDSVVPYHVVFRCVLSPVDTRDSVALNGVLHELGSHKAVKTSRGKNFKARLRTQSGLMLLWREPGERTSKWMQTRGDGFLFV